MLKTSVPNISPLPFCSWYRHHALQDTINQRCLFFFRNVSLIFPNGHLAWFVTLRICVWWWEGGRMSLMMSLTTLAHIHSGIWQAVNLSHGCPWAVNKPTVREPKDLGRHQIKIEGVWKWFCHRDGDKHTGWIILLNIYAVKLMV